MCFMARVVIGLMTILAQPALAQQAGGGRGGPGGQAGGPGGSPGSSQGSPPGGGNSPGSSGGAAWGGAVGPLSPPSASALSGSADADTVRDAVVSGRSVPYGRVLEAVESAVPGQVVAVSLSGRPALVYRIKVLTDQGSLHEVTVDARSGALLAVR